MGESRTAKYDLSCIIGTSKEILYCKDKALKASQTFSPVLIYGETGTGKELFVQAIHNSSSRRNKPFIDQNCAAIPNNLLESLLFGTTKGSFTGADDRKGLFEMADKGTLYFDEINSMPLEFQGKILRVLQEGTIRRVGSNSLKKVDVRIIASLNESPEELLEEGKIRRDLYYRLNVVKIDLPPLRDRKEDIPILINHFIDKYNRRFNACIEGVEGMVMEKLISYDWLGNVRELEHLIESMFNIKNKGVISVSDLLETGFKYDTKRIVPLKQKMQELEKRYILEALTITGFNVSKAAELLQIPRQTLQTKIKKMKIK